MHTRPCYMYIAIDWADAKSVIGLYSLTMVILPEVCPDHLLEYMAGLAGVSIVVACIVGPIVGGILTQYASWRWIFWIKYARTSAYLAQPWLMCE